MFSKFSCLYVYQNTFWTTGQSKRTLCNSVQSHLKRFLSFFLVFSPSFRYGLPSHTVTCNNLRLLGSPDVLYYLAIGNNDVSHWDKNAAENMLCPLDFQQTSRQINHLNFKTTSSPLLTQFDDILPKDLCPYSETLTEECKDSDVCCSCAQYIKIDLGQVQDIYFLPFPFLKSFPGTGQT